MKNFSTRDRLLASSMFVGLTLALAAPAAAQSTGGAKAACANPDANGNCPTSQDVVVTGSRIKRNAFTAPDPIQVITAEQATLAGYADTASILQQSSIASGSFQTNDQLTGFVVTGGPGTKTLNLRRLGANRTIILLDGKRLGPAGVGGTVGPVDLNVIPQSSLAKVEVLKDGASSIYGSDAVAGVVNIITKKNHDGAEISAYTSQSELGGGNSYLLNGDFGKTWDRGFFEIGGEYYEQERLARGQRDYTNCSEDYLFKTAGGRIDYPAAANLPNYGHYYKCYNITNNVISTSGGTYQYLQPGVIYPSAANGNNVPTTVSAALGGPLNLFFARQSRAGYPLTYPYANTYSALTDRQSVVSPDRHYNVNINAGYDISSSAHLYGQFLFSDRVSSQQQAGQFFPTLTTPWVNGNPNNIFAGTGVVPVQPVIAYPVNNGQNIKYYRGVLGLKGDFQNMGWLNRFSYDVFAVYSKSSGDYTRDAIYNDRVNATTTAAAGCVNSGIDSSGHPFTNLSNYSCSSLPAAGIPWLSPRVLSGNWTDAERAFLFFKQHSSTDYDQYIFEGDVTGDLFTVPAGAVSAAFGASYRHDKIDDRPDHQATIYNLWGSTSTGNTAGSDAVSEVYAELNIPLLKSMPLVKELGLDVSGRYSSYDSYGSTTTYKAASHWTVTPELAFRGSIGTSFRAPALYEQFLNNQSGFSAQATVDPCVNYGSTAGVSAAVQAACAALGIGPNYNGVQNQGGGSSAIVFTGGGKATLTAETSQAKSIGVVITPKHFGIDRWSNFSLSLDYFQFEVHNATGRFTPNYIITQCLQGITAYCSLFTRDLNPASPTYFNVLTVQSNYRNIASQSVRGLDATIHLDHNFGGWGKLSFDSNLTWTLADKNIPLAGSPVVDQNGSTYLFTGPDFTGNASVQWDYQNWTVFWYMNAIGKGSDSDPNIFNGDVFANTRYADLPNGISSGNCAAPNNYCAYFKQYNEMTLYHDLSVRKRFPAWNGEMTFGVQNLFNEAPPISSTGQARIGDGTLNAYDMIGRRYFLRLTKRW